MSDNKARILIIKLGALGDFVMQMDYVQAIHRLYPDADITFMTSKAFVPFVKCLPYVKNIVVDTHPRLKLNEWWRICKNEIADKKWDYIFDLQNSRRTRERYFRLVRFFSGFSFKWCVYAKNGALNVKKVEKKHRFCLGKLTLEKMYLTLKPVDLSVFKGDKKNFSVLPKEKFVLFVPGCSPKHPYKRWPKENYAKLARMIEKDNIPVVVLGTKAEADEISYICQNSKAISFQDKASLLDIPALANRALCVVGNDTGPMHMACLCKTYGIVLFCKITERSAQKHSNVKNIIAEHIEDISPQKVYSYIQTVEKEKWNG